MGNKVLDTDTGEIVEEPEFVKIYIRELCSIKSLTATQSKIFKFMLLNMNYSNIVSYGSRTKESFLIEHGMKNQTFNNNISGLIKAQLIERIGRSEFRVNKKYAVKTDWRRVQSIEWISKYTVNGKTDSVKFKEKE